MDADDPLAAYRRARRAHLDLLRRLLQLAPNQPGRELVEDARWATLDQALAARAAVFGRHVPSGAKRLGGDTSGIERFAQQLANRAIEGRRRKIH